MSQAGPPSVDDTGSGDDARARQRQFEATQRMASVGSWEWKLATGRVTWSDELYRIYGYAAGEIAVDFETYLSHVHQEDRARVREAVAQAVATGCSMNLTEHIVTKSGALRTLRSWGEIVTDAEGKPSRMIGICQDITEQHAAAEEVRRSERRYRSLFERSVAGVYRSKPDGRILDCNEAFARIFGYSGPDEVKATHAAAFYFDGSERDGFLEKLREKGTLTNLETKIRRKDGSSGWVVENVAWLDEGEEGHVVLGTILDVTEQRRLEDQVRQAQKMEAIGRLAGGIAHDFNNLMTTVIGFTDVVLSRVEENGPIAADLMEVRRAGERAAALTQQLLAFSRQQAREPKVLDLNAVVRDLSRMLEHLAGDGVTLTTTLAPDLPHVKADPGQLEQVLVNLVVNARDAMPDGGRLAITTTVLDGPTAARLSTFVPASSFVALRVADTGEGMDEETQRRAFEPFFTTKAKGKGTGLGLSTVYGVVKQSGGYVAIESAPGRGTTFHVLFPPAGEATSLPVASGAPGRRGEQTILLVEDEEPVRRLLAQGLSSAGFHVLAAGSVDEGLDVARRHAGPIDLLVSDWMLPDSKGDELLRRLREDRPGTRVVFVSGYAEEMFARGGVLQPGETFLMKPLLVSTLVKKVREVLAS